MEKLGIDNIKTGLKAVFAVAEAFENIMDDDKVSISDIRHIVPLIPKVVGAFGVIDEMGDEYKDLDEAELDELHIWIKEEFDLEDDAVEAKIEEGLALAVRLGKLIKDFIVFFKR